MLTLDQLDAFLSAAQSAGWHVRLKDDPRLLIRPDITARYPHLPPDYALFLSHVGECVNAKQNAWMLTEADFNAEVGDESTFHWNEWERMGLEAFQDDIEISRRISQFWTNHIPVMSAVHSDYAYIALRVTDGAVVYGYGPEFEESAADVCASLADYLAALGDTMSGRTPRESVSESGDRRVRREFTDFL